MEKHDPAPVKPNRRLPGLDVARGIAALCVLLFHADNIYDLRPAVAGKAYLAVDFFFMLSGYVMARTYEEKFAKGFSTFRFMADRYRRLWPIMALGCALGAPVVAIQLQDLGETMKIVIPNMLLLPTLDRPYLYPVNIAAWSILVELIANLAHRLLFWRLRKAALVLLFIGLIPGMCWICLKYGSLDLGPVPATLEIAIMRAIFAYLGGVILYRIWPDSRKLKVSPLLAFAAIPLLLLPTQLIQVTTWLFDLGFIVIACPLILIASLGYQNPNTFARWLGMISFPLYAVHVPVLWWSKSFGLGAFVGLAGSIVLATWAAIRFGPSLAKQLRNGWKPAFAYGRSTSVERSGIISG